MEKALSKAYRNLWKDEKLIPDLGVLKNDGTEKPIVPTIPFIGKNYSSQDCKILIYASAENLTYYEKDATLHYFDDDDYACNRHRNFFEWSITNKNFFFPNVHLGPVDNGGLSTIAAFVYEKVTGKACDEKPADFYERIAFGNFSKFTLQSKNGKNRDFASNSELLSISKKYVEQDLQILKPNIIIMSKTIYWTEKNFIDEHKDRAIILPIYQIFPRTVNRYIKPNYDLTGYETISSTLNKWYQMLQNPGNDYTRNQFRRKSHENFKHVFSYIDSVMREQNLI